MSNFIHLSVHTDYSMVDGICRIKPLIAKAVTEEMPAVAITDRCNLCGMVKFYTTAIANGIKPIVGADMSVITQENESALRLVLLCKDALGYRNLTQLISRAYLSGPRDKTPLLRQDWLDAQSTAGLIALMGNQQSVLGKALVSGDQKIRDSEIAYWQQVFDDRLYLHMQRCQHANEKNYNQALIEAAIMHAIPVVATNDVRFLEESDFEAHEARVCINEGVTLDDKRRHHHTTAQQYLKSSNAMQTLFSDLPAVIENSEEIAKRCNLELNLGKHYLPVFPTPNHLTVESYLEHQAHLGLEKRLKKITLSHSTQSSTTSYSERLEEEISVINSMGFAGYFLIVADFIAWAKHNDIPVGPGRGSGAGSLVAYALEITDIDPLQYDLLFERFLNPERVSMPDFDIDFCMDKRDDVIAYVAQRYGKACVAQIITFGTMAAKAVVRDVGRVLGHPYGFVDKLAKLIPFELGMTLNKALEQEPVLMQRYQDEDDVKTLFDLALKLEGITRNAGKHAGGVVIAPGSLDEFTPLYCEQDSTQCVTQFDKDDVESIGLVKFDFLGLRTLTIIDWACKAIEQEDGTSLICTEIPLDDPATFDVLKACQTTAIFQLESRGMKDLIKRLQPDCFEDIIALVALFRPGPLQSGMVDDFINRKHGRAKVSYPHPDLESILAPTYGVILYQEQVMQIAQTLAGYTLGGADLLRRAMGKKKPEEMSKQRIIFLEGAKQRGVPEQTAETIFDLMEKFAGYGFNKSHSAAYALVSYQTAWLKTHYPAAFMASVLSSDMDNTDKVVQLVEECRIMAIRVLPPDINLGGYSFRAQGRDTIIYGLGAIKGVGQSAIDNLVVARNTSGIFSDFFDFCRRAVEKKVNKRCIESLIRAGAFDRLSPCRASLFSSVEKAIKAAEQALRNQIAGQDDLFMTASKEQSQTLIHAKPWTDEVRLLGEKDTLGLYLTGHPIDGVSKRLKSIITTQLSELRPKKEGRVVVAGLLTAIRTVKTKSGKRMALCTIDDKSARVDATLFSDIFEKNRELLSKDTLVVFIGEASHDDFTGKTKLNVKEVLSLTDAQAKFAKKITIHLDLQGLDERSIVQLKTVLSEHASGTIPVQFICTTSDYSAHIKTAARWSQSALASMLENIRACVGEKNVLVDT